LLLVHTCSVKNTAAGIRTLAGLIVQQ